ncbi:MAG: DNA-binding protein [Rhizobacter sp.]|nr:DNA-binding protein [Rhizobacter sp.]
MDRTERFYKIERLLRSRGTVPFDHLKDELDVSPATLKRDLQYLRDRMDAPIVYDRHDNGYRFEREGNAGSGANAGGPHANGIALTGPSTRSGTRHELPGLWFSESEIHALLSMHQLMSGLDDDGVLTRHLAPMLDKLQGMLGADESESRELMKRVKIIGTARRRVHSRYFELLGNALVRRRRTWLRYFKRSDQSESEREVSPQRLVNYRNTWYLDAWCHSSDGLRRFALDAIRDARELDVRAVDMPLREIEAEVDAGYGIYGGGARLKWATLVFSNDSAQWVSNEEWHPQQKTRWLDDGRFELCVPYGDPTELAMDVLRHGDQVVVTGDEAFAATIARRLQRAAALYPST